AGLDADAIVGLRNVSAKDDRGNILSPSSPNPTPGDRFQSLFPDEWSGHLVFSNPDPNAKKLDWLEGELVVYKKFEATRLEFPMPPGPAARKQEGKITVEIESFEPGDTAEPRPVRGPRLRARLEAPESLPGSLGNALVPFLVGE